MRRLARLRPSPAMVVALIALFASLAGGAYALTAGSVTSRTIEDGTIRSRDVRPDGLNGGVIRESSLASVPSADQLGGIGAAGFTQSPDSATTVHRINVRRTNASQDLVFVGPLRFTFQCNGTDVTDLRVLNTDGTSARIWITWNQVGDTQPRTETYAVPNPPTGSTAIMPGYTDDAQATFTYSNSGGVDITGAFHAADAGAGGQPITGSNCVIAGLGIVAS